ncbi:MAG TPA: hypothetical protein VHQ46_05770 [Desulfobacteria bacterium]|nr:hypothetical protein [Desulfobacteria bacterium]
MAVAVTPGLAEPTLTELLNGNPRIRQVLDELIRRHHQMYLAKRNELSWKVTVGTAFLVTLVPIAWGAGADRYYYWLYILLLVIDSFACIKLKKALNNTQKTLINFGVIKHHLIGIIEVELCHCIGTCNCKDKFRKAVLNKYGISLY